MPTYVKISHMNRGVSSYEPFPDVNEITIEELMSILETSYLKYQRNTENIVVNNKIYTADDAVKVVSMSDVKNSFLILGKIPSLKTMSQYDEPYNKVANQCSWFCFEILNNKNNIVNAISKNDNESLVNIYHTCLDIGTEKRKSFGYLPYGENIDQVQNSLNIRMKTTQYGDSQMINFLDDFVKSIILRPSMEKESYLDFKNHVEHLPNNTMVILNRDGKSFVFMKQDESYWIFDSHKRSILRVNGIDEMNDYILEGNPNGFFYIIYGFF